MTDTAIKYDRDATELPDKNGNPIRVGDWVRDSNGEEWQVPALKPTEEHAEGWAAKKLGTLSLSYSRVEVQRYDAEVAVDFVRKMTFSGKVMSSRSLLDVERLDLSPGERRDRELERLEGLMRNLEGAQAILRGKLREAQRKHHDLLEQAE